MLHFGRCVCRSRLDSSFEFLSQLMGFIKSEMLVTPFTAEFLQAMGD